MTESRLTREGFKTVMELLRANEDFRRMLFSNSPAQALSQDDVLSPEDVACVSQILWKNDAKPIRLIDEKLVLCSSSEF